MVQRRLVASCEFLLLASIQVLCRFNELIYSNLFRLLGPSQTDQQVVAGGWKSDLPVETCVHRPNGLASFLTSTHKSPKKNIFRQTILYSIG